jgi:hypothetical protein
MAATRLVARGGIPGPKSHPIEMIEFFNQIVSSARFHETILLDEETIFRFRADIRKQRLVISYHEAGTTLRPEPETANADNQLYPGFRLHPGRSLDSWFFRPQPAGHRHVLLQRLTFYPVNDDGPCRELIAIPTKTRRRM